MNLISQDSLRDLKKLERKKKKKIKIPENQKYFWTKKFQEELKDAENSESLGTFDNFEDACEALDI